MNVLISRLKKLVYRVFVWRGFASLTFIEKMTAVMLLIVASAAMLFWAYVGFVMTTVEAPKHGGVYTEAIFGRPTYFNPLLVRPDGGDEAEASVVALVYSGLFRADGHGGVVPDLAERYDVSDDAKTYTVYLRQDAIWHDGESVTADDVVFTFQTIQNPQFTVVPSLAQAWKGVTVERVDDYIIRFVLDRPFVPFVTAQLRTGILPEHVWSGVEPGALALSQINRKPIGSGPFVIHQVATDANDAIAGVTVKSFDEYYGQVPYIDRIALSFYADENVILEDYRAHRVMGVSISAHDVNAVESYEREQEIHRIVLPSTFGVFLNPLKSAALAYGDVRTALAMATDRTAIVRDVLEGEALTLDGSFVPGMAWYQEHETQKQDIDGAIALLEKSGWKAGDDGIRAREGTVLRFSLVVPEWTDLRATAEKIKEQWAAVGADVQIVSPASLSEFSTIMEKREYGALLYAQIYFSFDADPFSFWHSSQKSSPGRNFAQFANKDIDEIITKAQGESDAEKREELHEKFDEIMQKNTPAVFLYSPYYLYVQSDRLRGAAFDRMSVPSERFADVTEWYIATRRTFDKDADTE
jgi:peptide/nickel transport system substrate-binding protein